MNKRDREDSLKRLNEILVTKGIKGYIKSVHERKGGVVIIVDSMECEKDRKMLN